MADVDASGRRYGDIAYRIVRRLVEIVGKLAFQGQFAACFISEGLDGSQRQE
jgi:hypothetical protein